MPRERTISLLALRHARVNGQEGWVRARWRLSDGTTGDAAARLEPETPGGDRLRVETLLLRNPTAALLRTVPLARIARAAAANPETREWVGRATLDVVDEPQPTTRRYRLAAPASRRLDDDHYRRVARAYTEAVAHGLQPVKTLAEDSGAPVGTVNRWIAGARERGYLPPAR